MILDKWWISLKKSQLSLNDRAIAFNIKNENYNIKPHNLSLLYWQSNICKKKIIKIQKNPSWYSD
jgi:hypothetical protein